jgi:hypothetical protein
MTTYTFVADPNDQFVNWDDPSVWAGGVVPNGASADVVFPVITTSSGSVYTSFVSMTSNKAYTLNSLDMLSDDLTVGNLTVLSDITLTSSSEIDMGGTLSAGSLENGGFDIQGGGQITVSDLTNTSEIIGSGLTVTATNLNNTGRLIAASGNLTVNVSSGGFTQFSGSTLTGGTYSGGGQGSSSAGTLSLNIGSVIAVDAANMTLNAGGDILSFDSGTSSYVPVESSLQTIAASGTLSLSNGTYNWSALTDQGLLTLYGATLNAPQLTVTGTLSGAGIIDASITNTGTIVAGYSEQLIGPSVSDYLEIIGAVTGNGTLELAPPAGSQQGGPFTHLDPTLELNGAASGTVDFLDPQGTLILDDPAGFTGTIEPTSGGKIVVPGDSYSSVTGYSYSGNLNSGMLTVQLAGGSTISLNFTGNFTTADFALSAGPQALSSSPPSLLITVTPGPAPVLVHDAVPAVVGGQTITLPENLLQFDDSAVSHAQETYTIIKAPQDGTLLLNGAPTSSFTQAEIDAGQVSYQETVSTATTDSFTFNVAGAGTAATFGFMTFAITPPQADFNGNGIPDILWTDPANGNVGYNDGPNTTWNDLGFAPTGYTVVGTPDFSSDGHSDILWYDAATGDIGWNEGPNTTWHDLGAAPSGYSVAGINDFAGNGVPEILWFDASTGDVGYNQGPDTTWHDLGIVPPGYDVAGTGDFNNNGIPDILWSDPTTGDIGYNDGPNTTWHDLGTAPTSYGVIGVGDFNNDGTPDILWYSPSTGDIGWNDGPNTPWHDLGTVPQGYDVVGLGNFDGSGTTEILFYNASTGDIGFNHGPNTTWHDLGTVPSGYGVAGA